MCEEEEDGPDEMFPMMWADKSEETQEDGIYYGVFPPEQHGGQLLWEEQIRYSSQPIKHLKVLVVLVVSYVEFHVSG